MTKYDDYDWEELPAEVKAAGKLILNEYMMYYLPLISDAIRSPKFPIIYAFCILIQQSNSFCLCVIALLSS